MPISNFHYLLHPYNTSLVTCCDAEGQPNIIAIAWLVPVSVNPPLVGMSIGPRRHSYGLIQATGEFVVNVPGDELGDRILRAAKPYPRGIDEVTEAGFTALPAEVLRRMQSPLRVWGEVA